MQVVVWWAGRQESEDVVSACWPQDLYKAVLRIRIHMFLGLPDPDPLVRGMDPDPSIIMQK